MSKPTPPAEQTIRGHVGSAAFQRGLRYFRNHRVVSRRWQPDGIVAIVQGSRSEPYELEVLIGARGGIRSSSCDCPMMAGCKHVAAALVAFHFEPGSFAAQVPREREERLGGADLRAWALEQGVLDVLDGSVHRHFSNWELYDLPFHGRTTVAEALAIHDPVGPRQVRSLRVAHERLWRLLERTAQLRAEVREYNESAAWRQIPPDESWLRPLFDWLHACEIDGDDHEGMDGPPGPQDIGVQDEPPALIVDREEPVPVQPGPRTPAATVRAARMLLDVLTHPVHVEGELRAWMSDAARTPAWERALRALDQVVAEMAPLSHPEGREVGWLVDYRRGALEVQPVWVRPYKTKPGLRTWKLNAQERRRLSDRRDREAADLLDGYGSTRSAVGHRALAVLVGHPRVVYDKNHVALRRADLGLDWSPERDGVSIVPTVGGEPVEPSVLADSLRHWAAERLLVPQPEKGRLLVVACSLAQSRLLSNLLSRELVFPSEAVDPLLKRFEALGNLVPITLHGDLRGEEVEGDRRPLLRLDPAPDGSLELRVRSRLLEGSRPHPPGEGPGQVGAIVSGKRIYAERDLIAEPEAYRGRLAALELPEQASFAWTLSEPEDALPVVVALMERQEAFQVEWARPKPVVSRPAGADDLKLSGGKKRDWFGIEGGVEVDGERLPLAELLAAVRANRRFVRLSDGGFVQLSRRLAAQLQDTADAAWEGKEGLAIAPLAAETLRAVEEAGATIEMPESFRLRAVRLREADGLELPVPEGLRATLRPYQEEGFRFLSRLAHWAPGAVLADDMGLGKTVQTLALMLRRASLGPTLVVAPASVGTNWEREAARFAPSLSVRSYRGGKRADLLDGLGPGQVLVTSWELMTRDVGLLSKVSFGTVVLDEAQAIKNANTRRAKASAELEAGFVVALTGTPVENRVGELWSLMRTVVPGLLGPTRVFRERFVGPIEREGSPRAQAALSRIIRPFLLRRLKSEVAKDLPPRDEITVRIELSPSERAFYDRFRTAVVEELARPKKEREEQDRFAILAALTRLRQLACDPRLVEPDAPINSSSKLDRLVHIAQDLQAGGHRMLVFSQFTTLLGLAREALKTAGLTVRYLDGSTSVKKRQAEVDAFQAGEGDAFLISLKAGGTGLNLTAASYVVHLDPWWNPAAEDQATDRAHRIGQTQPVTVLRFVAADTVEDRVLAMHAEKRSLVEGLLAGSGKAAALSGPELLSLLSGGSGAAGPAESSAHDALVSRFEASLDAELADGTLKRRSTAESYARAVGHLLGWVQAQGGTVSDPDEVKQWADRYLIALDEGELPDHRGNERFAEAAFRRLQRLMLG